MQTQTTFIFRLWKDAGQAQDDWEGQVVCVSTGETAHVRSLEEVIGFIRSYSADRNPLVISESNSRQSDSRPVEENG